MRSKVAVGLVSAGILVLSMACGGADADRNVASVGSDSTTSGQPSDEQTRLAYERYRQCMAEHGIEVDTGPSDEPGNREDTDAGDADASEGRLAEAERECGHLLPDGGELSEPNADDLDKQRAWMTCLREAGLEVIDDGSGMPSVGIPEGDQQAEQALQDCDRQVYGADQATTDDDSE